MTPIRSGSGEGSPSGASSQAFSYNRLPHYQMERQGNALYTDARPKPPYPPLQSSSLYHRQSPSSRPALPLPRNPLSSSPSSQHHSHTQFQQQLYTGQPTTSPSSPPLQSSVSSLRALPNDAGHARAYRSRKDRPCDNCRKRKSRCVIEEAGQGCQSCRLNGRPCTFEMSPTPRSRPQRNADEGISSITPVKRSKSPGEVSESRKRSSSSLEAMTGVQQGMKTQVMDKSLNESISRPMASGVGPSQLPKANPERLHELVRNMIYGEETSAELAQEPLNSEREGVPEEQSGLIPVVLGTSASGDPTFLHQTASSIPEENLSSSEFQQYPTPKAMRVVQVGKDPFNPVFFAMIPSHPYGKTKGSGTELGLEGLKHVRSTLQDKVAPLMVLYSQQDSAAFPLLMESQRTRYREEAARVMEQWESVKEMDPSTGSAYDLDRESVQEHPIPLPAVLATATLATASVYDTSLRNFSRDAWGKNLQALNQQFEHCALVTLQVALTDLSGRPSINTGGNFMSFSRTLAIAHMLGLHFDCSTWSVSKEERDVRIRLWWAIVIHDKWSSLCWGRPSNIHTNDFSVPLPQRKATSICRDHLTDTGLQNFPPGRGWGKSNEPPADAHTPGDTFAGLCRLTMILSEILVEFHSVRFGRSGIHDGGRVSHRIKAYLGELEDWKDMQPQTLRAVLRNDCSGAKDTESIPGTRSLQLSYLGVILLLCRTSMDAARALKEGTQRLASFKASLHSAQMVIEFLESLDEVDYNGYFLHYGSHHIANCLSVVAQTAIESVRPVRNEELLIQSTSLLERLLIVLSNAHRLHNWDLAELALTRSRSIMNKLRQNIPDLARYMTLADGPSRPGTSQGYPSQRPTNNPSGPNGTTGSTLATATNEAWNVNGDAARPAESSTENLAVVAARPYVANPGHTNGNLPYGAVINDGNAYPHSFVGQAAEIPIDATGLPYPLGHGGLSAGSYSSSHMLSSIDTDWLGLGLSFPQVYNEWGSN